MEPTLYNAMTGIKNNLDKQAVLGENLANASTPGFKAAMFQAQTLYVEGGSVFDNAIAAELPSGVDFNHGPMVETGRDMDVAIEGKGWFVVKGRDGSDAYTRYGGFQLNENGQLILPSGEAVIGEGGPIAIPPAKRVDIGTDGTISIVPAGAKNSELVVIDRIKLVNIDLLKATKGLDGHMRMPKGSNPEDDFSSKVVPGMLEGSNVNTVDQMVQMISSNRESDQMSNLLSGIRDKDERLAQLLQVD